MNDDTKSLGMSVGNPRPKLRYMRQPPNRTTPLFGRLDVFIRLDEILGPDARDSSFKSVALHGLGGVGKSCIASSYAENKFSEKAYDVVLWIQAEKDVSLQQSFTDIALRLELSGAHPKSHDENRLLVQHWFQSTQCKWLVIYDNVESANVLMPYWPRSSSLGRVIITTRNPLLALDHSASGIEITSWDVDNGAKFLMFLLKERHGQDTSSENLSARKLSEKLGGHPLAISQVASLIQDGKYNTIRDFTNMYLENPRAVHARDELTALWGFAFQSLEKNGFSLLGIISFLEPDNIPLEIFTPQFDPQLPPDLIFLKDKSTRFSTALRELTTLGLVKCDKDSSVLSVHRLIQAEFRCLLEPSRRQRVYDDAVTLLSCVVPKDDDESGQLYDRWEGFNRYLQHALNLRDIFEEERKSQYPLKASKAFCNMMNSYQRYLYENCAFEECERTCALNRNAISTITTAEERIDLEATIMSHQAQVAEKLGNIEQALNICQQQINIRLNQSPPNLILIAWSFCNLGIAHSSANNFEKALEDFEQSHKRWDAHFSEKGERRQLASSIRVSEARCMIGLERFNDAEEILDMTIAQIKGESPVNFGTKAYAYFCMGCLDRCRRRLESAEEHFMEAQNAWRRGEQTRLHPFNAGILYNMGACCLEQGKIEAAIKHFRDSLEITSFYHRLMPVEHGRNLFKLSKAMIQNGDESIMEVADLRRKAEACLKSKQPGVNDSSTDSAYDNYIPDIPLKPNFTAKSTLLHFMDSTLCSPFAAACRRDEQQPNTDELYPRESISLPVVLLAALLKGASDSLGSVT
ncbi:P-loop containing nucleoside triphosphate hydrolase protein [Nemania sp. FL0031]|nr:P-loop containing nucleoside triphosphate hydrolase protein [Nemania sp. FL0031]